MFRNWRTFSEILMYEQGKQGTICSTILLKGGWRKTLVWIKFFIQNCNLQLQCDSLFFWNVRKYLFSFKKHCSSKTGSLTLKKHCKFLFSAIWPIALDLQRAFLKDPCLFLRNFRVYDFKIWNLGLVFLLGR